MIRIIRAQLLPIFCFLTVSMWCSLLYTDFYQSPNGIITVFFTIFLIQSCFHLVREAGIYKVMDKKLLEITFETNKLKREIEELKTKHQDDNP